MEYICNQERYDFYKNRPIRQNATAYGEELGKELIYIYQKND